MIAALANVPEVIEVHTITGQGDLLIRIVARSNQDLQRLLDQLRQDASIIRIPTVTVLETRIEHRTSGMVGLATVAYGAGSTNALTALAEARMARIPLVLIVGDAPTTGQRPFDIDQTMTRRLSAAPALISPPLSWRATS